MTASQLPRACPAKKRTSTSESRCSSCRQGLMVFCTTAASTRGTRRSSILATLNLMFGTYARAVVRASWRTMQLTDQLSAVPAGKALLAGQALVIPYEASAQDMTPCS